MTLFNADDFGITEEQSQHILECYDKGVLTGVSLMPNSPFLPECAKLLPNSASDFNICMHLNLTEGCCLSEPLEIPLLVSSDGRFRQGFAGLLFSSLFHRKEFRKQVTREAEAQYDAVCTASGMKILRFDGHQHIQMIPCVLGALCEVIKSRGVPVEYIRCSREPLLPYLKHPKLWCRLKPVNLIKNLLLNFLGLLTASTYKKLGLAPARVMGLLISGDLEQNLVEPLLPSFEALATKKEFQLELVMHPGYGIPAGGGIDKPGGLFEQFYLSSNRKLEYDCLLALKHSYKE